MNLYPHNQSAYDALLDMLATTNRACVIQPCGTGKAMIAFHYAQEHPDERILWISPSEYIFGEQGDNLKHEGIAGDIQNIEYMTYTAAASGIRTKRLDVAADTIILDEFHRAGAPEWSKGVEGIISKNPSAKVIGFTATEVRYSDNGRNMAEELFGGNIASYMSLDEAWLMGILPIPKYVSALYEAPAELGAVLAKIEALKDTRHYGFFMSKYERLRRAIEDASNLDVIFEKHLEKADSKIIVFCRSGEHLEELVRLRIDWFGRVNTDIHAYRTYEANPQGEKEYRAFKEDSSNALKVLYCIDQLNEGVHIKGVDAIVMVRPTCSPNVFKQQLGRALDVGGNSTPLVFDFVNNLGSTSGYITYGSTLEAEYRNLKKYGKQPPFTPKDFVVYDEILDPREFLAEIKTTVDTRMGIEDKIERLRALCAQGASYHKMSALIESLRSDYRRGRLADEDIRRIEENGISVEPRSAKRRVVCYETGEVFESVSEAARSLGIKNYHNISKACKNKGVASGFHWYYADDPRPEPHEFASPAKRKIVCVETGEVFESIRSAGKRAGIHFSAISTALRCGTRAGGYHWRDEEADEEPPKRREHETNKRVVCYETGEVFTNAADAAQHMSVSVSTIYTAINTGGTCAGSHWYYESENGPDTNKFRKRKHRMVICIETGETFKNGVEAAKSLGLSKTAVTNIIGREDGTAGGYHWRYATEEEIAQTIPRREPQD